MIERWQQKQRRKPTTNKRRRGEWPSVEPKGGSRRGEKKRMHELVVGAARTQTQEWCHATAGKDGRGVSCRAVAHWRLHVQAHHRSGGHRTGAMDGYGFWVGLRRRRRSDFQEARTTTAAVGGEKRTPTGTGGPALGAVTRSTYVQMDLPLPWSPWGQTFCKRRVAAASAERKPTCLHVVIPGTAGSVQYGTV